MAPIPLNEVKLHIETALASVRYAERMIQMADQFRREGNHAAANGALMMAWNIRENTESAMNILPNLTPEHAALLSQSERERLSGELNSAYENLNRLGEDHYSTEDQWDECYKQEAEWYLNCFGVGLAAHAAETIVASLDGLPESKENIEMIQNEVAKCCQVAQESMEYVQNNEPPADAPFPQTRQQSKERACNDCLKPEQSNQQLSEKLEAFR